MVSGQRGQLGAHVLEEVFHVTVPGAVPERVQTLHLRLVARSAADTRPRTFYVFSAVLVSRLQAEGLQPVH